MKNLFLLLFLSFAAVLSAQNDGLTTEVEIYQLDSVTFVETYKTVDAEGFVVRVENVKYSLNEFALRTLQKNDATLAAIDKELIKLTQAEREVNQLRRFVIDSLGVDYDSAKVAINAPLVLGEFRLIEVDNSGARTISRVDVRDNPDNPKNLRIIETEGAGRNGAVVPIHRDKIEVRNFFSETATLLRFTDGEFRGRLTTGERIVFRR